jgi:hypothetical protein
MRILFKNLTLAFLPLILGLAAGWAFAFSQESCGKLVGPLFTPMCHWKQLEYQLLFQSAGTLAGCLIAAMLGSWLDVRRRRAFQRALAQPKEVS